MRDVLLARLFMDNNTRSEKTSERGVLATVCALKGLHIENTSPGGIQNSVVNVWAKSWEIEDAAEWDTYTAKQI